MGRAATPGDADGGRARGRGRARRSVRRPRAGRGRARRGDQHRRSRERGGRRVLRAAPRDPARQCGVRQPARRRRDRPRDLRGGAGPRGARAPSHRAGARARVDPALPGGVPVGDHRVRLRLRSRVLRGRLPSHPPEPVLRLCERGAVPRSPPAARDAAGRLERGARRGHHRSRGGRGLHLPTGTAYLLSTSDRARNTRASRYALVTALPLPFRVRRVDADALRDARDVLFYFTGRASVDGLETLRFQPGAIADHLTSTGGVLNGTGQMSVLRWLDAGATASYGAVVEPCNFPMKFPQPSVVMAHYARGETLIEAYWKSVAWPGQGVFVGEPLAAPFRPR